MWSPPRRFWRRFTASSRNDLHAFTRIHLCISAWLFWRARTRRAPQRPLLATLITHHARQRPARDAVATARVRAHIAAPSPLCFSAVLLLRPLLRPRLGSAALRLPRCMHVLLHPLHRQVRTQTIIPRTSSEMPTSLTAAGTEAVVKAVIDGAVHSVVRAHDVRASHGPLNPRFTLPPTCSATG